MSFINNDGKTTGDFISGYEIDVYAEYNNYKIAVQCKQYERSNLNIRDTIHEWDSKRKKINVDKIIIMVYGQEITQGNKSLANDFDITLWDEDDMDRIELILIDERDTEKFMRLLKIKDGKSYGTKTIPLKANPKIIWWIIWWIITFMALSAWFAVEPISAIVITIIIGVAYVISKSNIKSR